MNKSRVINSHDYQEVFSELLKINEYSKFAASFENEFIHFVDLSSSQIGIFLLTPKNKNILLNPWVYAFYDGYLKALKQNNNRIFFFPSILFDGCMKILESSNQNIDEYICVYLTVDLINKEVLEIASNYKGLYAELVCKNKANKQYEIDVKNAEQDILSIISIKIPEVTNFNVKVNNYIEDPLGKANEIKEKIEAFQNEEFSEALNEALVSTSNQVLRGYDLQKEISKESNLSELIEQLNFDISIWNKKIEDKNNIYISLRLNNGALPWSFDTLDKGDLDYASHLVLYFNEVIPNYNGMEISMKFPQI